MIRIRVPVPVFEELVKWLHATRANADSGRDARALPQIPEAGEKFRTAVMYGNAARR